MISGPSPSLKAHDLGGMSVPMHLITIAHHHHSKSLPFRIFFIDEKGRAINNKCCYCRDTKPVLFFPIVASTPTLDLKHARRYDLHNKVELISASRSILTTHLLFLLSFNSLNDSLSSVRQLFPLIRMPGCLIMTRS